MQTKSFKQILARKAEFNSLLTKMEELRLLTERVHAFLDPLLVPHCQVANLREGCLVIAADSSAFATRLRYCFPDLLNYLRFEARLFHITALQCVVSNHPLPTPKKARSALPLSKENAKLLSDLADEIDDSSLSDSLKKLSSRVL